MAKPFMPLWSSEWALRLASDHLYQNRMQELAKKLIPRPTPTCWAD